MQIRWSISQCVFDKFIIFVLTLFHYCYKWLEIRKDFHLYWNELKWMVSKLLCNWTCNVSCYLFSSWYPPPSLYSLRPKFLSTLHKLIDTPNLSYFICFKSEAIPNLVAIDIQWLRTVVSEKNLFCVDLSYKLED